MRIIKELNKDVKESESGLLAIKKFEKTKNRQLRSFFYQRALKGDENHKGVRVAELLIET